LLAVLDVPEVRARVGMAPAGARDAAWHGVGPPAPPVSLRTRAGQEWNLDANRGEVVLLAFWASWCRPCLDELPVLDALASARPGLRVLAVSMDDGPNALRDIDAMVASMGLSLPVAHAPELGRAYGVEALPSVRLIGRDGSVQLSARGHSAAGIRRLRAAVDAALAASTSAERPVGTRRGTGTFSMRSWRPLAGVGGITGAPGGAVVSVHGARPLRVGIAGEEPLDVSRGGEGGPIAWLGGPVTGEDGGYWLRAWHPDGAVRWFQTLPSRLVAVVADGRHLFVALEDELLVLAADGSVLARHELAARGLAMGDDGDGVWAAAADTRVRLWVDASGRLQQKRSQAPGIRRVGPGGLVMTGLVRQAVMGPFGTGGEDRLVVALADGRVIGLDGAGRPALVLTLPDEVSLAVVQADDGPALLGIAVPELGIGLAALGLP
ncbi:MAG: TlpA disulfide reductase family protein, partial [Myxococcota bacterium]|nr:TlpA disulfide reductase family protein [Myxococcota bacterium]